MRSRRDSGAAETMLMRLTIKSLIIRNTAIVVPAIESQVIRV